MQGHLCVQGAIFGVLYTLSKEKEKEVKAVVIVKQIVEFSQLMARPAP